MSGDFNSDFNFDYFKETYTGVGNASIKVVANAHGTHGSNYGEATIKIEASASGAVGVRGVAAATIAVTASAIGETSGVVVGDASAIVIVTAAAEGSHPAEVVGNGAAIIEVHALAHGTHEALAPPLVEGKPGRIVVRVPRLPKRKKRIVPVTGVGRAIILVTADGKGEHHPKRLTPVSLIEQMPMPAVAGRGGARLGTLVLAKGEHIDTEGWNQDFLLLVAA
jgi:hypothetical protein